MEAMEKQMFAVKLERDDSSTPWGFRLEGGVDLGHPLNIQKVTPGSVADRCGIRGGDLVIKINKSDVRNMRHEEAKMEIIRSSNDFEMIVERRPGGYYPPMVTSTVIQPIKSRPVQATSPQKPLPAIYKPAFVNNLPTNAPSASTSLKSSQQHFFPTAGSSHNVNPLPFGQTVPSPGESLYHQTIDGRTQRIMHNDYNTPLGLYSQKNVNNTFGNTLVAAGVQTPASPRSPGVSGVMRCGACGRAIGGVFVKVQNTIPMHPECLKCSKCGIGLRNVGYFYINETLYCDVHARQVIPPPAQGLKPVLVYK